MGAIVGDDITVDFKQAMRRLTTTISLITTRIDGQPYGMAATAVQSVTADPPSVLVCLNKSASITEPLLKRGRFGISLLRTEHADLVPIFSGKVKNEERFGFGAWEDLEGIPVLEGAQATMICDHVTVLPVGSHHILVGQVRAVRVCSDIAPLLYQDGALARSIMLEHSTAR